MRRLVRPARLSALARAIPRTSLILLAVGVMTAQAARGESLTVGGTAALPEAVTEDSFAALIGNSPFIRSIGLSQSIVLTGMARIGNEVLAILHDLETRESYIVSEETNPQGWQLMGVRGDESDLKSLTAQIKVAGSEVVSIRYEKIPPGKLKKGSGAGGGGGASGNGSGALTPDQVAEAKKAAVDYREGYSSDGYPRQPPPEMVAKLSKMSINQREDINRQMIELRNRGMGMEERRNIYEKMVDRTLREGR